MRSSNKIRSSFFYVMLALVAVLTFLVLRPYAVTLAMAATLAVISQPVHDAILRIVRQKATIAAILTMLVMGILVLAPLGLLILQVTREATALYERILAGGTIDGTMLTAIESTIEQYVRAYLPDFHLDLEVIARQALRWITGFIGPAFANTLQLLLHFSLGGIAFFYFLRDGQSFLNSFAALSPLTPEDDSIIFNRLSGSVNSIIKGMLLIAVLEGIASGTGFWLFGVPSPALWGSIVAVMALIPGVGPSLIIIPAVIYLWLTGSTFAAIGMAVWGIAAVSSLDNVLGPIFVGRGVRIHPLFILYAVIGGIHMFGPVGFVLGPLVLSLLFALLDIFRIMQSKRL
jgi:predicted PurR-regulated permease PerM